MFVSKAEISFTYNTASTLGEELHSDRPSVLSSKLRELFGAYTSCPTYSMTAGTTPIEVKVAKSATPKIGDEQFAYTSTLELPSGAKVLKSRTGSANTRCRWSRARRSVRVRYSTR
ncbi:hypothetical protein [Streptomyces sp. NRRL WC-3618]|uniref:hypothetical protein n=1 Tax=Streptomyces sp. NRRL WC-3618 TaxID=1519490 RepID=UPI0006B01F09|nr:hypothetical protein [Streptomyces sp. NRRL WC-3618]